MDTIVYSYIASIYEESESIEFIPIQINWQFLQWQKLSSVAAMRLLSVALTTGVLSVAGQALALEKIGSSGTNVTNIQRCLKQLGFLNAPATGKFATLTQRAVIGFQRANKLTPDGVVGSGTQTALQRACQARNASGELKFGSRGTAVSQLQRNLKQLGYFNAPNTGYFGTETQQAVIRFQRSAGIGADGVVGSRTAQAIRNATGVGGRYPVLSEGSSGQAVTRVQQRLRQLGYFNANPTGNFQRITKDAVIAFQRRVGISATGVVNWQTWNALEGSAQNPARPGLSTQQVRDLQQRLQDLGYFNTNPTGTVGAMTREAIIQFQRDNRLSTDGIADVQILEAVRQAWNIRYANQPSNQLSQDVLFVGDRSENVRLVQQRLLQLGFFARRIDGYFDEYTRASVANFQQSYQINPTGRVDWQTWQALNVNQAPNVNNVPIMRGNVSNFSTNLPNNNRYVVIVPINNQNTLNQVRRYVPNAYADKSNLGSYVNAGAFSDRLLAEQRSKLLRSNGLDARVQYF
ncbi:peptidoglycan-binding domain-containing protein [Nostoc sp. UHCC 0870]|uniref:peptidoglycan-binding domain-containing protein n=1 Tax=Nostoc sp. UHCC 0870 TaxID=2914041 RepID=UPI001EDF124B|nr:peptidoglycan-binding protein [Nostoc sp. UHCC 0870]UKO97080.1 peptidoglycan-binding protein [Nostoc sp. UHCC 0870]